VTYTGILSRFKHADMRTASPTLRLTSNCRLCVYMHSARVFRVEARGGSDTSYLDSRYEKMNRFLCIGGAKLIRKEKRESRERERERESALHRQHRVFQMLIRCASALARAKLQPANCGSRLACTPTGASVIAGAEAAGGEEIHKKKVRYGNVFGDNASYWKMRKSRRATRFAADRCARSREQVTELRVLWVVCDSRSNALDDSIGTNVDWWSRACPR